MKIDLWVRVLVSVVCICMTERLRYLFGVNNEREFSGTTVMEVYGTRDSTTLSLNCLRAQVQRKLQECQSLLEQQNKGEGKEAMLNDLKSDKRALELEVKSLREEVANHQRSIGDALKRRDESDDNISILRNR